MFDSYEDAVSFNVSIEYSTVNNLSSKPEIKMLVPIPIPSTSPKLNIANAPQRIAIRMILFFFTLDLFHRVL